MGLKGLKVICIIIFNFNAKKVPKFFYLKAMPIFPLEFVYMLAIL